MIVASGTVALNNGSAVVDRLTLTNAGGVFSFTSGNLSAKTITVANGSPFVVGDGVNPATLQLSGGTFSFANGLVVSANATVTGCGTIIGTISNSGTINTNCAGGLTLISPSKQGSKVIIPFSSQNGVSYTLEFKNSLTDSVWTPIPPTIIGSGGPTNVSDNNATNKSRFYRLHVQ
jgi:hypothetical protein